MPEILGSVPEDRPTPREQELLSRIADLEAALQASDAKVQALKEELDGNLLATIASSREFDAAVQAVIKAQGASPAIVNQRISELAELL